MHSKPCGAAEHHHARDLTLLIRTLRGVEKIAASEIGDRLRVDELELAHREIRLRLSEVTGDVLALGTADDVFLVLHEGAPIGRHRSELGKLRSSAQSLDLDAAASTLAALRPVEGRAFDVSASALGRRNYSRFEIEDAVGDAAASSSGWRYESRSAEKRARGDISLRVHLARDRTTFAVRIAERPLHRRQYRIASRPGALHPPLARALAVLAAPACGDVLLDPFCGTGTIPIEAKLAYPRVTVIASDLDPLATESARINASAAGIDINFAVWEAACLPLRNSEISCVVTNPPWGLSVRAAGALHSSFEPFWDELSRIMRSDGRIMLLSRQTGLAPPRYAPFQVVERITVRVSGALADIISLAPAFA
jgi:tRNA (guanine6-N2)-methyltransferase